MPRLSMRVLAGLSASALAVLMSQTAMAGLVDVHVSAPTVRISVPTVRAAFQTIQVKTSAFKTTNLAANRSASHRDHRDGNGDRGGHGAPVVAATYRGTPVAVYGSTYVRQGHGVSNPQISTASGPIVTVGTALTPTSPRGPSHYKRRSSSQT
jgi:hypothetical protein